MPSSIDLRPHRARLARAAQAARLSGNPAVADEARRDYAAAKLDALIRETIAQYPPLSVDQRSSLAALVLGGAA